MKRFVVIILLMSMMILAQQEATIYQDNTHLRKGPGSYYPLLGILVKDAIVTILKETSGWVKISTSGREGWISNNALSQQDRKSGSLSNTSFPSGQPSMISKASASGAVKGFAQTYFKKHDGSMTFLDQYDKVFFQPREYENFRQETYRNRNMKKIRKRYKRIKIENKEPEINSYLEKLGFAVAGQIATGGLETDIQKLRYINMVGNLIVESTPLYYYPFKFYILSDERPIAYATPNGMIFVSQGLLNVLQSEAELACVLGHEISHVVQQHGYSEVTKRKTQIVAEDAFDELEEEMPEGFSDKELDDLAFQMFEAATARRQTEYEYEADMMGVIYAYRAGYDPHCLASVLKTIKSMTSRDFWHPESNWQYDAIEDRSEKVTEFISAKLTKNSDWNVENKRRYNSVFH